MPKAPVMDNASLSEQVRVRGRFLRSIHLERDFDGKRSGGYYVTESAAQTLQAFALAFESPAERAMTLIGPYGSGKSAFCVHLASFVSQSKSGLLSLDFGGDKLYSETPLLETERRTLVPVLIVGSRQPLASALVTGISRSLIRNGNDNLLERVRAEYSDLFDNPSPSPRSVAELYGRTARLAAEMGIANGLLLIVDELGKFLEYAALHPENSDIFVLQEVAEAASRSGDCPFIVLTVLHQNTDAYAQKLGRTYQAEWAKVGERFRQLSFFPSDRERVEMVGNALEQTPVIRNNDRLKQNMAALSQAWLDLDLPAASLRERFSSIAQAAYPINPIALLALPPLFRKSGQSHRSLFAFLSGEEPHALGRFLRETTYDPANPALYSLDLLFDYAAETLIAGWSGGNLARQWAEAVEIIEQAATLSDDARRTLKCIALLGLLKEPRLPASLEVIRLGLVQSARHTIDLQAALTELQQRRLIVYRRRSRAYRLWEGGDIDIEAELATAKSALPEGVVLNVATVLCPPPRLIARRHSFQTGTVRIVRVIPTAAANIALAAEKTKNELTLLLCLATNRDEMRQAEQVAQQYTRSNCLFALALETEILRDAAADVAAAERVAKETDGLIQDRAARRELAARREEGETTFKAEWDRLFGSRSENTLYFYRGEPVTVFGARGLSSFLSVMADDTYCLTPRLRNELINRSVVSSAAAAARRTLIEAMLTQSRVPHLGIQGFPPERSMYECVLRASGIHREGEGGIWVFGPPPAEDPAGLLPTWQALERFLFDGPPELRRVSDLFANLVAAPYGVTEGVLPILLCAFLLANGDETTFYREGTFVPEPSIADYEVLLRRPELFAVAGSRVVGFRAAMVERLSSYPKEMR